MKYNILKAQTKLSEYKLNAIQEAILQAKKGRFRYIHIYKEKFIAYPNGKCNFDVGISLTNELPTYGEIIDTIKNDISKNK